LQQFVLGKLNHSYDQGRQTRDPK